MSSTSFFGDAVGFDVEDTPELPLSTCREAALTVVERLGDPDALREVLDVLGLTERLGS